MGCGASKDVDKTNTTKNNQDNNIDNKTELDTIDINSDTNSTNNKLEKEIQLPPHSKMEESHEIKLIPKLTKRISNIKPPALTGSLSTSKPHTPNTLGVNNNKPFDKSTSSIQIDNNVDFTVIKMDNNKNESKETKDNDGNSTSSTSEKKGKRNKNKINENDLELLNVDDMDTEQTEVQLVAAQKPLGYKGDYYTINQELMNSKKVLEGQTEPDINGEKEEEEEDDANEPTVITNSFFTEEPEKPKLQKKKSNKFFGISKKNDLVIIKNNSLSDSQRNSSNSLEFDINDFPEHGKLNRNNNNSMHNANDNGDTHPFSVL